MGKTKTSARLAAVLLICLLLLPSAAPVLAADGERPAGALGSLVYYAAEGTETGAIRPQWVGEELWLFLPASADLSRLALCFSPAEAQLSAQGRSRRIRSGEAFDLEALFPVQPEDGRYTVAFQSGGKTQTLNIMRSAGIASLYVTSRDPDKGRSWVDGDKENRAKKGGVLLLRPDGTEIYQGTLKNIKSRGNSTWNYPKKPYQFKLSAPGDLMETGEAAEAETTWILLANYADGSLLRNRVSFDLASALGLEFSPHCRPVDLYYDGEYRGSYLLSEKTEISGGRVSLRNLEREIEELNPGVEDFDALETRQDVNRFGNRFQYVEGVALPEDYTGGYLLELDYQARAASEKCWFTTTHGYYVAVKSPEYLPEAAVRYISELYQRMENSIFSRGVEPETGLGYTELVDGESLAREYLLLELARDMDAYLSSTFFYKPEGEEKLYAGPVWDFDTAWGISLSELPAEGFVAGQSLMGRELLKLPGFAKAVETLCAKTLPQLLDTLLGSSGAGEGRLRSLEAYGEECAASRRMDAALWPETSSESYGDAVSGLADFLRLRGDWLCRVFRNFDPGTDLPRFMDASPQSWYYEDMVYMMDRGILQGLNSAGTLCGPDQPLTRAMAVTILHRLAGEPEPAGTAAFSDVSPNAWYAKAAAWGSGQGILTGYPDGSFRPNRSITRQELAVLLYRYRKSPMAEYPLSYADAGSIAAYALPAMKWASAAGLYRGNTANQLLPGKTASRAEAAALFRRFMESSGGPESP